MLILDGDGIDRRNSHDGQIRTRLEAFLKMLEAEQSMLGYILNTRRWRFLRPWASRRSGSSRR